MKIKYDAVEHKSGIIEPTHEIEIVCISCGFDLDESELDADTCSDCGAPLNLRRSVSIQVTSVPLVGRTVE